MSDNLHSQLSIALRDAVPDLDRLAVDAVASGRRRRRTRRAGIAASILATAAAVGGTGVLAAGGGEPPTEVDIASSDPTARPGLREGQELDLGRGITGTVTTRKAGLVELGESTRPGHGKGFFVVVHGRTAAIERWWSRGFGTVTREHPGITVAVTSADASRLGLTGLVDQAPVTVADADWACEWTLMDDKAACQSADGGVAGLVIRPATDHAAWIQDVDKGADPGVYTTEPHGNIFITVQGGRGTTNSEIEELGRALVWVG